MGIVKVEQEKLNRVAHTSPKVKKMLVFPTSLGSLGILDGIYVKEVRNPLKPYLLNHSQYWQAVILNL